MTESAAGRHTAIPRLGLGTYPLAGQEAEATVAMALELGYRHIDTAQMYGNERAVGRALAASGLARQDVFIVTKVDPSNLGAARFAASAARSVEDLGTVPDLLLIHWPPPDDQIDATVERLVEAKAQGAARAIGVSNFTVAQMQRAQKVAAGALVCNQVEFHPLLDQSHLLAAARQLGMMLTGYCPLARGRAMEAPVIRQIAARHGRPANEIVLGWIIQQGVAAIPMTRKRANAASNLNSLTVTLSEAEMQAIAAIGNRSDRVINPGWMAGRWD